MRRIISATLLSFHFKEHAAPFLRENKKIIIRFLFTLFFIGIGIWFIKHEHAELGQVKQVLIDARWQWVLAGIGVTASYIMLQGQMYVFAFASVARKKVSLTDAVVLFIKRNFISVFLPAGGISSLAFYSNAIENKGIKKSQIHFASSIYGFTAILSVVIVAIPAFLYSLFEGTVGMGEWFGLAALLILSAASIFIYRSVMNKGVIYSLLTRLIPAAEVFINDLRNHKINSRKFILTLGTSVIIEITGMVHVYLAMVALDYNPSVYAAVMGYIVSVIFLVVSPFLRGLGAIEVSMSFVLIRLGFGDVEAVAITLLYRFFEFWIPLFTGILAFLSKLNKLLLRILPAIFLLALGIINIVSVMTPAIPKRLILLKDFLPVELIHASNYLVMMAGFIMLVTAAFMLKGLKTAWWFALCLSLLSFIGHITKAIDFEEASVAFLVMVVLIATRKEYYVKTNPRLRNVGLQTSLILTAVILVYGIIGFYFLDEKHFNIDFNLWQSARFTLQNYLLFGSDALIPASRFAEYFLYSLNISGFISITFLIYTLIGSYKHQCNVSEEELTTAGKLVTSYGKSSLDYFKTYPDKFIFFTENKNSFLAYRISGSYSVVLENPVSQNTREMKKCILEFDKYCQQSGLKCIYYRVPEESLPVYHSFHKKDLFLGQEGVVDLSSFSLVGGNKRSMRNAVNKVRDSGYKITVHTPTVKDGILQKMKSVSDDWLNFTGRSEIVFSQGMFLWEELKQQTIITVENDEEKIIAFLNVIPDYVKGEATYDLIRKTHDAPNGVMDFILIELFEYLKSLNFTHINIGFAPMSGLNDPHTFPERSMRFAYAKIKSFSHFKGLRDYKEKFEPVWQNKYLIYQHDYDLLQVPSVLAKVIKP